MGGPRYTVEQLERLRESPLVKKPEELPSIEQWMDVPSDQGNTTVNNNNNNTGGTAGRRARTNPRDGEAGVASAHRTEGAMINPMGHFTRRQSMQPGDEAGVGPPKFSFASATRPTKAGQPKEPATAITSADGEQSADRFSRTQRGERWRDGDGDRTREKGFSNGRRGAREDGGEGWTSIKGRKSLGQEDFDRGFGRNGDRERKDGDPEAGDTLSRRSGNNRWARRDETAKEGESNRFSGAGQGGWRDRERNREREKDREWTRGAKEEDPEWMDTPVGKKEAKAHTQEDFQRWKEQMKAKDAPVEEKEEASADFFAAEEMLPTMIDAHPLPKAVHTPLAFEPNLGNMFGNWGKDKSGEAITTDTVHTKPKPDKKSRFMTMFAKPEEPVAAAPQLPPGIPTSPGPAVESNADREGFQRILQMLGGVNMGAAPGVQPGIPTHTNGARLGGIPLPPELQHYSPPTPDSQKPRAPPQQAPKIFEQQALLEHILSRPSGPESRPSQQGRFNSMSPDNDFHERFALSRPDSKHPVDDYPLHQPAARNNNPQDANLAAILNGRDPNRDRDTNRDFLLNLMQQPRGTPPQLMNQNLPRQPPENMLPFYEQPQRHQGPLKGRGGLPPGFMEDPRIYENEMRREAERREQHVRELQQQEAMRGKNRMPMGFPGHDDPALAGLQRRNTGGEIPRQMTNMGIPSQAVPDLPYMGGRQPGMPPTPQERPNIAPPPGFGGGGGGPMRQPPGLGGHGPGPQQQQMGPGPSFSAGNTPLGHPPGFPPPNNMRGGMYPGGPPGGLGGPGGNGMPGPPQGQGYFPPPGYGLPMGMRDDPRMMFNEQQFGGPGPRQQQRQGPPPNMYQ